MQKIDSDAKTIWQLLANARYALEYYQREYSWQTKQVTDLIDDLTSKFLDNYEAGDEPTQVTNYGHYFLGSIIINNAEGQRFIIDGQQRITTLTLLLMRLRCLLEDKGLIDQVTTLIYSLSFGEWGFNLDIPDRKSIMEALYSGKSVDSFEGIEHAESVRNIAARYKDIEDYFELQKEELPCFVVWLLQKVYLSEITAYADDDAYTIFETMNDRGLSLTPSDMLRGYLLSKITNTTRRNDVSDIWRDRIEELKQIGKGEESEAIKAWLRSQYAQSTSDFDAIGSEFHRWVQDPENDLQLKQSQDFENFIKRDFEFYTDWYCRLRRAANSFTDAVEDRLECVFYNAQHNKFTLQYPILLAPLRENDSDTEKLQKVQIVASYLDILIYQRIWNSLSIAQNTMANLLPPVISIIRGKNCNELRDILHAWIQEKTPSFADNDTFGLHGGNRRKITLILARMTDYVGIQSGESSQYRDYMRTGNDPYEIEHIWANNFEHHADEFSHESEFEAYRECIGGLLLLPKSVNASSGDDPYNEKRKVYAGQNLLAQTLTEQAYKNRPGFKRFKDNSGLPFRKHPEFKKEDLNARQKLYLKLAEQIWNPERLRVPHSSIPDELPGSGKKRTINRVTELIPQELREHYETKHKNKIRDLYIKVAELLNLVEEKNWRLTPGFRKTYCALYVERNPIFGVTFSGSPRFTAWIPKEKAERLSSHCKFERYSDPHGHAVYPLSTSRDELIPIFEFAYNNMFIDDITPIDKEHAVLRAEALSYVHRAGSVQGLVGVPFNSAVPIEFLRDAYVEFRKKCEADGATDVIERLDNWAEPFKMMWG